MDVCRHAPEKREKPLICQQEEMVPTPSICNIGEPKTSE